MQTDILIQLKINGGTETQIGTIDSEVTQVEERSGEIPANSRNRLLLSVPRPASPLLPPTLIVSITSQSIVAGGKGAC